MKFIFSILIFSSLQMAYAAPATVTRGCVVNEVLAISPLGEDLNYTRGSGRGYDVAFYSNGTELSARVGNLSFGQENGDRLGTSYNADGSEVDTVTDNRSGVVFQLNLGPSNQQSGYYGQAPTSERSALLTFRKSANSEVVKAAHLLCF